MAHATENEMALFSMRYLETESSIFLRSEDCGAGGCARRKPRKTMIRKTSVMMENEELMKVPAKEEKKREGSDRISPRSTSNASRTALINRCHTSCARSR